MRALIAHLQLRAFVPLDDWVWSATYVTRSRTVSPQSGVSGLHSVTAVSAASMVTQLYVGEAEEVFKNIYGESSDFLTSMPTEEEEQAASSAASVEAASEETSSAAAASVEAAATDSMEAAAAAAASKVDSPS